MTNATATALREYERPERLQRLWTPDEAIQKSHQLLANIRNARKCGQNRRHKNLIRKYLMSRVAKVRAAYKVLGHEACPATVSAFANGVDAWREPDRIGVKIICKPRGGQREICILTDRMLAAHYMIKSVFETDLDGAFDFGVHNYSRRGGGGKDAAVRHVKDALRSGLRYCAVGDIRDCFGSVNAGQVVELLNLPPIVAEKNFDTTQLHFARSCFPRDVQSDAELPAREWTDIVCVGQAGAGQCRDIRIPYTARRDYPVGPRGLMQGAPTSNLILGRLLREMAAELPDGVELVLYVDDFVVLAATPELRAAAVETLSRFLAGHPFGPFDSQPRNYSMNEPGENFDFLGYELSVSRTGQIAVEPNHKNYERMYQKLLDVIDDNSLCEITKSVRGHKAIRDMISAFPEIDYQNEWVRDQQQSFRDRRDIERYFGIGE